MISSLNALKVGDGGADHASSGDSAIVSAGHIFRACEHCDRDLVNPSDVDQVRLTMTVKVVL